MKTIDEREVRRREFGRFRMEWRRYVSATSFRASSGAETSV
jgi:hypothetical protein